MNRFLQSYTLRDGEIQTHFWSPGSKSAKLLHIPEAKQVHFYRELYGYLEGLSTGLESPDGPNCLTEKQYRADGFQYFSVDIDLKAENLLKANWDKQRLRGVVQAIVRICDKSVSEATGIEEIERVVAARLLYKLHIYYPIVVNKQSTLNLAKRMQLKLEAAQEIQPVYTKDMLDSSIYGTGLRIPYCHKGVMMKKEKMESEKTHHAALIPEEPCHYCYYPVDIETFEMLPTTYTLFRRMTIHVSGIRQEWEDKIVEVAAPNEDGIDITNESSVSESAFGNESGSISTVIEFLTHVYGRYGTIDVGNRRPGLIPVLRSSTEPCPIAGRCHQGNKFYLTLSWRKGLMLRCHDEDCEGKSFQVMRLGKTDAEIVNVLIEMLALLQVQLVCTDLKTEAFHTFDGNRWREDKGIHMIHQALEESMADFYSQLPDCLLIVTTERPAQSFFAHETRSGRHSIFFWRRRGRVLLDKLARLPLYILLADYTH
ncbi:hypothetical protein BKA69DRAFT_1039898 [Paraphysoderma sedebokerense]|nr:hypothetical protein BKA69DRAFT_1039898 [Paraphysoderma sedebokerense]